MRILFYNLLFLSFPLISPNKISPPYTWFLFFFPHKRSKELQRPDNTIFLLVPKVSTSTPNFPLEGHTFCISLKITLVPENLKGVCLVNTSGRQYTH